MKVIHALEKIEQSIFLAGPTPRSPEVTSWRHEALKILDYVDFKGTVYVPESDDWGPHDQYDDQVKWEWEALNSSTIVLFWIPRDLAKMPAFTTNVEFGLFIGSGKCVMGYPVGAPKMNYLHQLAVNRGVPVYHSLDGVIIKTMELLGQPMKHNLLEERMEL
jgi:hypothetical protein